MKKILLFIINRRAIYVKRFFSLYNFKWATSKKTIPYPINPVTVHFSNYTFLTNRSSKIKNQKLNFFVNLVSVLVDNEILSKIQTIIFETINVSSLATKKSILV